LICKDGAPPSCSLSKETKVGFNPRAMSVHHWLSIPRSCVVSLLLWILHAGAGAAGSGSIESDGLMLPVRCTLGETCWIANYVDVDPTSRSQDFRCQPRTYDGHDGVDIAIRDLPAMRAGVPVLASAPGVVRNVRDGVEDVPATNAAARAHVKSRECGNGVVIQHGNGWETQYCHLRRGSVQVKPGERVARATPLGLVGLSGATEFPHLHLTVRHNGTVVDPFTGQAGGDCGVTATPLWRPDQQVRYEEVALYNAGFAGGPPDIERIRQTGDDQTPLTVTSPALVFWVDLLGVQAGDTIRIVITGPDGERVVEQQQTIERTQARRYAFAGRRNTQGRWQPGTYSGEVVLTRASQGPALERRISRTMTIAE
jgi:murein DD-endopeptidase MepM/ murein hydrolase activator NlpD